MATFSFYDAMIRLMQADARGETRDKYDLSVFPYRLSALDSLWTDEGNYDIEVAAIWREQHAIVFAVQTKKSVQPTSAHKFFCVFEDSDNIVTSEEVFPDRS